jgi:hypothetical protein
MMFALSATEVSDLLMKAARGFTYTSAIVTALTVVLLLEAPNIISVTGNIFNTFFRPREWSNLESTNDFTRQRNFIAFLSSFAASFLFLKLGLCSGSFFSTHSFEFSFVLIWGLILAFFLLRGIILGCLSAIIGGKDTFRKLYSGILSYFILLTLALATMTLVHLAFPSFSGRPVLMTFISVLAFLNLCCDIKAARTINEGGFSFFFGFLYLCTLEILPTAIFVKAAITF